MQTSTQIRSLLRAGDRRTVGQVAEVVRLVLQKPELVSTLVACMVEADEGTRMRAAELQPYTGILLGLLEEDEQQELRWHLAVILPRLRLDANERRRTSQALQRCLTARSSIVKTFALQGLADLTAQEPALMPLVVDLLRTAERTGTAAMKARSRKLLSSFEGSADLARGLDDRPIS